MNTEDNLKKEILEKLKIDFCPMCGDTFDNCDCGELAFSVKWLRGRLNE